MSTHCLGSWKSSLEVDECNVQRWSFWCSCCQMHHHNALCKETTVLLLCVSLALVVSAPGRVCLAGPARKIRSLTSTQQHLKLALLIEVRNLDQACCINNVEASTFTDKLPTWLIRGSAARTRLDQPLQRNATKHCMSTNHSTKFNPKKSIFSHFTCSCFLHVPAMLPH